MKNFCVIHVLLLVLLMLVYQCARAQDVLITQKGDTVRGNIKLLSFSAEKKVQVTTTDKKKQVYSIFQVHNFILKSEKYVPVKGPNGYAFMKVIKEGYLSLYAFQLKDQLTYDGTFLKKKDSEGIEVPNLTFRKQMTKYLSDCPEVSAQVDDGKLGKSDLEKIIDAYNNCISQKSNAVAEKPVIVDTRAQSVASSPWDALEEKIKSKPDFEGKTDALDMVGEIKSKLNQNQKIPNFLLDGLKRSLANTDLTGDFEKAVQSLN